MTKKFSIKKLVAGVLAAAMVVTALPVSGLSAKAAEADTKPVYVLYDANRGEHYFTADAGEKDGLLAIGWKEGNIAWMSPAKSNTPVYGLYNPNNGGDHYYTADANEKNGLLAAGWKEGDVKFYSDDAKGVLINTLYNPNEVVRNHHYTASLDEANGLVALGWQNHTNTATAIYGVGVDASNMATLVDMNGLQSDGTGLEGDVLGLVFGSNFGVPKSVAWYKNGAVVATATNTGLSSATDGELILRTSVTGRGAGEYYAQVENTTGNIYKTNTITILDEGTAVVSGFAISDNYEAFKKYAASLDAQDAAAIVPTATTTGWAVVDITVNKLYAGTLTIIENPEDMKDTIPAGTVVSNTFSLATAGTNAAVPNTNLEDVKKAKNFTNEVLYEKCVANTDQTPDAYDTTIAKRGIFYVDDNDVYHVKLLADLATVTGTSATGALTRGKEYVAVFKEGTVALAPGDEVKDLVITKPATCPYVVAPTKVTVTGRQSSTASAGWKAQLVTGSDDAKWINGTETAVGELDLFGGNAQDMSDGVAFATDDGTIAAGASADTTTTSYQYVQAKFVAKEGIFSKDEFTLKSDVVETAIASGALTLKESDTNAKDAVVEFTNLRQKASGTVYVAQGDATNNTADKIAAKALTDPVASAKVSGGSDKVTVSNVFKKIDSTAVKNDFVAVFVPDDQEIFSTEASGVFTLAPVPTNLTLASTVGAATESAGVVTINPATSKVLDQFGNDITTGTLTGGFIKTFEMTVLKAEGDAKTATITFADATSQQAQFTFTPYQRDGSTLGAGDATAKSSIFYTKIGDKYFVATKADWANGWKFTLSDKAPTL